jgi:hypothetical protein
LLGRFIQKDPIPSSIYRNYVYASNQPNMYSDPHGTEDVLPAIHLSGLGSYADDNIDQREDFLTGKFRTDYGVPLGLSLKNYFNVIIEDPKAFPLDSDPSVDDYIRELNKTEISVLSSHGANDNFQRPNGRTYTGADINRATSHFSKLNILILQPCFGFTGALSKAFASKGAEIVLSSPTSITDKNLGAFTANFIKALAAGCSINDSFRYAGYYTNTYSRLHGLNTYPFVLNDDIHGIRCDIMPGINGHLSFNILTGTPKSPTNILPEFGNMTTFINR